jgi:hypothetical protein
MTTKSTDAVLFIPGRANSNRALSYRLDVEDAVFLKQSSLSQTILYYNSNYKYYGYIYRSAVYHRVSIVIYPVCCRVIMDVDGGKGGVFDNAKPATYKTSTTT